MKNTKAVELIKEYSLFEELQDDVLRQYSYVGKHDLNLTNHIVKVDEDKITKIDRMIKSSLGNRWNYLIFIQDWKEKYRLPNRDKYLEGFDIIYDQMIHLLEEEIEIDWDGYEEEVHRINDLMVKEANDYIVAAKERH
jgi:hypothetical protein